MALYSYLRESSLSDQEIYAGLRDGTLEFWKTAIDGERWFRKSQLPMICGIPKLNDDAIAGVTESEDDIQADDVGEIQFEDVNGNVVSMPGRIRGVDPGSTVEFGF